MTGIVAVQNSDDQWPPLPRWALLRCTITLVPVSKIFPADAWSSTSGKRSEFELTCAAPAKEKLLEADPPVICESAHSYQQKMDLCGNNPPSAGKERAPSACTVILCCTRLELCGISWVARRSRPPQFSAACKAIRISLEIYDKDSRQKLSALACKVPKRCFWAADLSESLRLFLNELAN